MATVNSGHLSKKELYLQIGLWIDPVNIIVTIASRLKNRRIIRYNIIAAPLHAKMQGGGPVALSVSPTYPSKVPLETDSPIFHALAKLFKGKK